jgi:hypothetical protein
MKTPGAMLLLALAVPLDAVAQTRSAPLPICGEIRTVPCVGPRHSEPEALPGGWYSLFNGRDFDGWRFAEDRSAFRVEEGMIVADGRRSHLFYDGPLMDRGFRNFEIESEIMTLPGANSAIYIHTQYLEGAWPNVLPTGYEIQINNSAESRGRTASVFTFADLLEPPVADNVWFRMHVTVTGQRIQVRIDERLVNDYTEPADKPTRLTGGTFALQAHLPGEVTYFRNLRVKPLPD